MKVIITGGGGFLGSRLAVKLLQRGELTGPSGVSEPIDQLVLFDAFFHQPPTDERVRHVKGDIGDRAAVLVHVMRRTKHHSTSSIVVSSTTSTDGMLRASADWQIK